jgi:hypothetical protein
VPKVGKRKRKNKNGTTKFTRRQFGGGRKHEKDGGRMVEKSDYSHPDRPEVLIKTWRPRSVRSTKKYKDRTPRFFPRFPFSKSLASAN